MPYSLSEKADMGAATVTAPWLAVVLMLRWPSLVALHFRPGGLGDDGA